jgi:NTE family protein
MGAVFGAARALGANLPLLAQLLATLDLNTMLQITDNTVREVQKIVGRGLVEYVRGAAWRGEGANPPDLARLRELFSLLTARKTFAEALIPLAVVAADVETGQQVVLQQGTIADALTASTAVPGIFSPVAANGRYLIDGGIVNKVPVDVAIEMGANAVLAVDTGAPLTRRIETQIEALLQAQRSTSKHLTQMQLDLARRRLDDRLVVLRPDVGWIRLFAFEYAEEAIQAGRASVSAHLDRLDDLLGRGSSPSAS